MGTSVQSRAWLSDMFVRGGADACTLPAVTVSELRENRSYMAFDPVSEWIRENATMRFYSGSE